MIRRIMLAALSLGAATAFPELHDSAPTDAFPLMAECTYQNPGALTINGQLFHNDTQWRTNSFNKPQRYLSSNGEVYYIKAKGFSLESLIASRLLQHLQAPSKEQFPPLSLCTNQEQALQVLSREMAGFQRIYSFYRKKITFDRLYKKNPQIFDSLPLLGLQMYLIGGGDPHPGNIVFNPQKRLFGMVDLDVAFKKSWYEDPSAHKVQNLKHFYHKLALPALDCERPTISFLLKRPYDGQYFDGSFHQSTTTTPQAYLAALETMVKHPWVRLEQVITEAHRTLTSALVIEGKTPTHSMNPHQYYVAFVKDRYDHMAGIVWSFQHAYPAYSAAFWTVDDSTLGEHLKEWCRDARTQ